MTKHDFTAAKFFDLPCEDIESIVTQSGSTRDTLAFYGTLNYSATKFLKSLSDQNPNDPMDVGKLTLWRKCLISNATLALLCKDLFFRDITPAAISGLNIHSKGTIVEALIEQCEQRHGSEVVNEKLCELFTYMLAVLPKPSFSSAPVSREDCSSASPTSKMATTATNKKETMEEALQAAEDAFIFRLETQILQDTPTPPTPPPPTQKHVHPSVPPARIKDAQWVLDVAEHGGKFSHGDTVQPVKWISRRGNWYTNEFFVCCGSPCKRIGLDYKYTCCRTHWKNPSSFHAGVMRVYSSKSKGGGRGPTGGSNDHVPHGATPTWSCCGQTASAEGCRDNVTDDDDTTTSSPPPPIL